MENYKIKTLTSELSDVDVKNGIVTGYFSSFGNIDSDGDMIVQGAFSKTIQERGPNGKNAIFHLLQHDIHKPLGKPVVLHEDAKGLYFESKIISTSYGEDTLKLYEAGVYNEHSIGYRTIKWEKVLEQGTDRVDHYKLLELFLYEGSTVTFGANQDTPFTGLKGQFNDDAVKQVDSRFNRIVKALKVNGLSDEIYQKLEIEFNQIQQYYKDIIESLKEPGEPTHDEPIDICKLLQDRSKLLNI